MEIGQFGKNSNGEWMGCCPNGMYCNLTAHEVKENSDGSITVSPSILITGHEGVWHGYLENGIWREC